MEGEGTSLGEISSKNLIDRSKVKILLCDNDSKSSHEILELLCKCSYQVSCVKGPRQVIDTLNAEGHDVDIILSEVDLPMSKGFKMLKYIMLNKEFHRIPIIMMSCQDEISIVIKCLRLGAADYLVKPLRTNELLNLWTHMWRRRRMLGLDEKDIMIHNINFAASDPSDTNTNSTTLFSDDTDEKSQKSTCPEEISMINHGDSVLNTRNSMMASLKNSEDHPDMVLHSPETGSLSSCPKKTELKVGESSAFFTYVKSSLPMDNSCRFISVGENIGNLESQCNSGKSPSITYERKESRSKPSRPNRYLLDQNEDNMRTSEEYPEHVQSETTQRWNHPNVYHNPLQLQSNIPGPVNVSSISSSFTPLSLYMSGPMNQIMIPSTHMHQGEFHDASNQHAPVVIPTYDTLPHFPHMPTMAPVSYYPLGLQHGQIPAPHHWPTIASSSSSDVKSGRVKRREAALIKFMQKRKNRCFDKRVRYVNRKTLAEKRPRIRGQFVRQDNGLNVDLNEYTTTGDESNGEEEEDDEEEPLSSELRPESSLE